MRIVLVALTCISVSSANAAQPFKDVPLGEAFLPAGVQAPKDMRLPFDFTVPAGFSKRRLPEAALWGTAEDMDAVTSSGDLAKSSSGLFTLKISLNVAYDERTRKFSGEDAFVARAEQSGFSKVALKKTELKGFPMMTFTGESNGRRVFLHYIALGSGTLLINYFPSVSQSKQDEENVTQFLDGLRK
jgi:hypothetical protein